MDNYIMKQLEMNQLIVEKFLGPRRSKRIIQQLIKTRIAKLPKQYPIAYFQGTTKFLHLGIGYRQFHCDASKGLHDHSTERVAKFLESALAIALSRTGQTQWRHHMCIIVPCITKEE